VIDLEAKYVSGELHANSDALDTGWFSKTDLLATENLNATTTKLLKKLQFL